MADTPWLTIVGLGEDGPEGLSAASRHAIETAEVVMGAARHLSLIPETEAKRITWPVPFADGLPLLFDYRGRKVVTLASGDPFWFGAGSVIARDLDPSEWRAIPGPSTFSLAAARLGWPLETTGCFGLHAVPFARLRPHLATGARALVLVRDGSAVKELADWLCEIGFGETEMTILEALGGPRERLRPVCADAYALHDVQHPVCVGLVVKGSGVTLPATSGKPDSIFDHDGQITKRPVRALTLSALAPKPFERLWDLGAGSGSVGIEWLLTHPTTSAIAVEANEDRCARIRKNADALGADRMEIVHGSLPDAIEGLPSPDAVFIGGGMSKDLLNAVWALLKPGRRIVANAVTLETESLLIWGQATFGGDLLRIELSVAAPLGRMQGWRAAYPIVQWTVTK
jgi:precorrin-6Y C5,15-methyltransferase (decarboxylating)